jgi:hypothetical protein
LVGDGMPLNGDVAASLKDFISSDDGGIFVSFSNLAL